MSPWDLYKNIAGGLGFGRLTMETADPDILRFTWHPTKNTWLTFDLTMREFQASGWHRGQEIAHELREKYREWNQ